MCSCNTSYSANMSMNSRIYGAGMYSYTQGVTVTGMNTRNISGSFICNTVNVIDMSGQISRRTDCRPVNITSMPFSIMY